MAASDKQLWLWKARVFAITFGNYMWMHAMRKKDGPESWWFRAQVLLHEQHGWSEPYLGVLDSAFMVSYAIGLFGAGLLGDAYDTRLVLVMGLAVSAVLQSIFAALPGWGVGAGALPVLIMLLNGLFHSTGWPCNLTLLARAFGIESRATVMGIWASSAPLGNVVGSALADMVESSVRMMLLLPALFSAVHAVLSFMFLRPSSAPVVSPRRVSHELELASLTTPASAPAAPASPVSSSFTPAPPVIGLRRALFIPGVLPYSFAYACLKSVNYTLFFWLPSYVRDELHGSEESSDLLPALFDTGSVLGGILSGVISDRINLRAPLLAVLLILSSLAMMLLRACPNLTSFAVLLTFAGFVVSGPSAMMGSTVAADLGQHPSISGDGQALSTVTGIIDGIGSLGAALAQALVPLLAEYLSWSAVFVALALLCIGSVACIASIVKQEWENMRWSAHVPLPDHSVSEPVLILTPTSPKRSGSRAHRGSDPPSLQPHHE